MNNLNENEQIYFKMSEEVIEFKSKNNSIRNYIRRNVGAYALNWFRIEKELWFKYSLIPFETVQDFIKDFFAQQLNLLELVEKYNYRTVLEICGILAILPKLMGGVYSSSIKSYRMRSLAYLGGKSRDPDDYNPLHLQLYNQNIGAKIRNNTGLTCAGMLGLRFFTSQPAYTKNALGITSPEYSQIVDKLEKCKTIEDFYNEFCPNGKVNKLAVKIYSVFKFNLVFNVENPSKFAKHKTQDRIRIKQLEEVNFINKLIVKNLKSLQSRNPKQVKIYTPQPYKFR